MVPIIFNKISYLLFQISCLFFAAWAVAFAYLALTLRPRFEKLFHDTTPSISYDSLRWGAKAGRFNDYLLLTAYYNFHKKFNTTWYRRYGGFNFPAHATLFEVFITKLSFTLASMGSLILCLAGGILLYFQELQKSDVLHFIIYLSIPTAFITGVITFIPYFYLKARIPQRFEKIIQHSPPTEQKEIIFFMGYLSLLANYASEQRRNTKIYSLLQPYNFLENVSYYERVLGKLVWWAGIFFLSSTSITLIALFIRIYNLK